MSSRRPDARSVGTSVGKNVGASAGPSFAPPARTARAGNADEDLAAKPGSGAAPYIGRFAPSPTGPLHTGSLVAALASWLDARAHGGRWLVRIEDVDRPRCVPGAEEIVLGQLSDCGLVPDVPPVRQSARTALYQAALDGLIAQGWAYPCACSRSDIEAAWAARGMQRERHAELAYPGTCRHGLRGRDARAVRVLAATQAEPPWPPLHVAWTDRRLGPQRQNVTEQIGDFVLKRADGLWAYQLAVVVDDAAQGVTHVVRGQDLAENTARQIHLQRLLGLPTPQYLHTPLVLGANGEKLSKQNGAQAIDLREPAAALAAAAHVLGLAGETSPEPPRQRAQLALDGTSGAPRHNPITVAETLEHAVAHWRARWLA